MSLAIALYMIGAGVIALGSLLDTASRLPGMLRTLEADRRRLSNAAVYSGPIFNRHGREIEGN